MLTGLLVVSTFLAPAIAPKPAVPSGSLVAFAQACQAQRGIAVQAFRKFLARPQRTHAGWTVLVSGTSAQARETHAARLAEAAGATLLRVTLADTRGKSIGETEKNLDELFAQASDAGVVLFFDEADALFGKRTEVKDAHDKYANQEVSYLLDRIRARADLVIVGMATPSDDVTPLAPEWVDAVTTAHAKDGEHPLPWHALCWPRRG